MLRRNRLASDLFLLFLLCAAGKGMAQDVDLELVIATDNSGSIDSREARLQRQGVANAFQSPGVVNAIAAGTLGRIAVAYLDWSNHFDNNVVIDWTIIHDEQTARDFAGMLLTAPPSNGRRTSISSAIMSGIELLDGNRFTGARRVIDISGDGPNNYGLALAPARDEALARGIVINGLPIIQDEAAGGPFGTDDIEAYYARCVIGGEGAFVVAARGFDDFAVAIRHKLILEISGLSPGVLPAAHAVRIPAASEPGASDTPSHLRSEREGCDQWAFGIPGYGRF